MNDIIPIDFINNKFNDIAKLTKNNNVFTENVISELMFFINSMPGIVYWKNKEGVYLWHNNFNDNDREKHRWPSSIVGKTDEVLIFV